MTENVNAADRHGHTPLMEAAKTGNVETVKDLVKQRLARDYAHIRLKDLRRLAIDEIYLGRKQKYLTLVIDQESGRIIWVGRGKAGEALHGFWRRLKGSGAKIEAVAMDMSQAYASAVARHLPEALIVFDRFHVMKLMNEKLDDLRRELVRQAESEDARVAIKGTRWLLLYRRDNLPKSKARQLQEALDRNRPLATAYLLKEELALAWEAESWEAMADYFCAWCEKAIASQSALRLRFTPLTIVQVLFGRAEREVILLRSMEKPGSVR